MRCLDLRKGADARGIYPFFDRNASSKSRFQPEHLSARTSKELQPRALSWSLQSVKADKEYRLLQYEGETVTPFYVSLILWTGVFGPTIQQGSSPQGIVQMLCKLPHQLDAIIMPVGRKLRSDCMRLAGPYTYLVTEKCCPCFGIASEPCTHAFRHVPRVSQKTFRCMHAFTGYAVPLPTTAPIS